MKIVLMTENGESNERVVFDSISNSAEFYTEYDSLHNLFSSAERTFTGVRYIAREEGYFLWYYDSNALSTYTNKPLRYAYLVYDLSDSTDNEAFFKHRFAGLTIQGDALKSIVDDKGEEAKELVKNNFVQNILSKNKQITDQFVMGSYRILLRVLDELLLALKDNKQLVIIGKEEEKIYLYTALALLPIEFANTISFLDNLEFPKNQQFKSDVDEQLKLSKLTFWDTDDGDVTIYESKCKELDIEIEKIDLSELGNEKDPMIYKSFYVQSLYYEIFDNKGKSGKKKSDWFLWSLKNFEGIRLEKSLPHDTLNTLDGLNDYGQQCLMRTGKMLTWLIRKGEISGEITNFEQLYKWIDVIKRLQLFDSASINTFMGALNTFDSSMMQSAGDQDLYRLEAFRGELEDLKLSDVNLNTLKALINNSRKPAISNSFNRSWQEAVERCVYNERQQNVQRQKYHELIDSTNSYDDSTYEKKLRTRLERRDKHLSKSYNSITLHRFAGGSKDLLMKLLSIGGWVVFMALLGLVEEYIDLKYVSLLPLMLSIKTGQWWLMFMSVVPFVFIVAFFLYDVVVARRNWRLDSTYVLAHICTASSCIVIASIVVREVIFAVLGYFLMGGY